MQRLRYFTLLLLLLLGLTPLSSSAFEDGPLAVAAAQYRQLIRDGRNLGAQTPEAWLQQAERLAKQNNANRADTIAAYETALAGGADSASTWLKLSELWQAHAKQQEKDDAEYAVRERSKQRSQQAAWNALQAAKNPSERARAWFRLGERYDQEKEEKKAMLAYRAGLAVEDSPRIAKRYQELMDANAFQVKGVEAEADRVPPRLCLNFSSDLAKGRQLHYADYLVIQPAIQPTVSAEGQQLCIEGVQHGQSYAIKIRAGVPSAEGEKTSVTQEFTARINDHKPLLGFRGAAYVLPKGSNQQVPLTSINVEQARVKVLRVNDRNLLQEIENRRITNLLDGYQLSQIANKSGEAIWNGTLTLVSGERNREVLTALPIAELLPNPLPGVYIIAAQPAQVSDDNQWEDQATQWVVVSDLGLFTLRGNDGLHVFVRSLGSTQVLAGVNVRLYARNNSELAQAQTDSKGYVRFDPGLLRGNGGREPAALMAFGNGDYNFLDLTKPAFDLSDRGVEGRAAPRAVDGFLYTERGVYRPGETVELMTLLRDSRGYALDDAPLTLKILRPDEVEAAQLRPTKPAMSGYHSQIALPMNARTGAWTVKAYTDPQGEAVGQTSFQVEDFVPQQLRLELNAAAPLLKPNEPVALKINGRFLYGAPAANLKAEAEVILREDANPYPNFPNYRFGLVQETWSAQRFPMVLAGTNAQGTAETEIRLQEIPDTTRPLQARVRVSLFEPGGRAVTRSLDLPYRVQPLALGIKPRFGDHGVPTGQPASFDIVAVNALGQAQEQSGLSVKLVREEYEYYWYHDEGRWNYKMVVRDRAAVASQSLNISAAQPAVFTQPALEWGRYRLEVADPHSPVASSLRFTVGWFDNPGQSDSPDQMKVTLDQPRYAAGSTAKVFLHAPFAGEVLLNVIGDRLWLTKSVRLPAEGTSVELNIPSEWGPGVYIAATAFRAADAQQSRAPGRAIGVAWVGLDAAPRTLQIALNAPSEWSPRQTVELPITVSGVEAGKAAYITVAAVDEGILQLTDFITPDPLQYFLGKRRLGMQMLDLYGKLIETGGRPGTLKVGGDADSRQLDPAGIRTVKTLALFSGPVALQSNGQAKIPLTLPDFNGQLRLMAVAWDQQRFGRAEATALVRDPLIARVNLPRFLAPDDSSRITVSVQNLNAPLGDYAIRLTASGAVAVEEPASFTFKVTDASVQNQENHTFTLRGVAPGTGQVQLHIEGTNGFNLVRSSEIGVRPAQTIQVKRSPQRLDAGASLRLNSLLLNDFMPGTGQVRLSVASRPNLNVPELLAQLDRYPYGCLEQTTSRALPLLYFNEVASAWAQAKQHEANAQVRVQGALQRILEMQDAGGGFGLWGADSPSEEWLSAYAMDFIVRARQQQYLLPENAWKRGLAYLRERLNSDDFADAELGWRAYALYVLGREQQASIGDLRYLHDNYLPKLPNALAQAQLGATLARYAELERAKEAFSAALQRQERLTSRDYGSPLRDHAALLALLAESGLLAEQLPPLAEKVANEFNQRRYTSTQEQAWLLLAAHALLKSSGALRLNVGAQTITSDPFYLTPSAEQLNAKLLVVNQGEQPAWAVLDVSGVPLAPQPPAEQGFSIARRYYTRSGQLVDPAQIQQHDLLVAVISGMAQGSGQQQALVVDLLPAGLEIENNRLAHNAATTDFVWLPALTETKHTEIRDDRFVAALDLDADSARQFTLAYLVRAVTPGVYQQPAIYVEDMYQPEQFGRGALGKITIK